MYDDSQNSKKNNYHLNDSLSQEVIRNYVDDKYKPIDIYVYQTLESTNQLAKELAKSGAKHGTVIIAEEQTMGRGRRGRTFFSPNGTGIYMSIITKPKENIQDAILITTAAAVAVKRAIKLVTNLDTKIKWVNDLYYENKKMCGILAEAVNTPGSGDIHSIIVGIGINFVSKNDDFPADLQGIATALYEDRPKHITRNQLCSEVINQLLSLYEELADRNFLKEYKENSLVLGKEIQILEATEHIFAKAIDIDNEGGLVVEFEDGSKKVLNSGEISIRPRTKWE